MTAANVALNLVYRGHFACFMLANIAVPLVSLMVWRAALAGGAQLPVDAQYLTTYFVILSFVTMATSSWLSSFLSEDIRLGRLSIWLIRPASVLHDLIANNLSEKLLKTAMLIPMIGVLWLVFADSVRVPASLLHWLLFVLSTFLGAVLVFVLDVIVGALAFWLDDTAGLNRARQLLAEVLSGAIVPLALMPAWAQGFVTMQPFRFTVSFPVEILCGNLAGHDLATGFALQVGYVLVACLIARLVWSAGLRSYSAVGA
jgi:ABC-2 type transport system permease protein